ncbi:MAG TPA: thiamine pyrophosphate-dependent dehydrogenase E1 component subunit alpha [Lacipirellulaceae bacterium]|nr:thiamine pyrophosphate-dependent dehydrogenase E1 component subunit alpha [Lacipirellulaceae bacterium]
MDGSSQLYGKAHSSESADEIPLRDSLPMKLRVPTPPHRPGDVPCFAPLWNQSSDLSRPDSLAPFSELRDHASGLIRVLHDDGHAQGPWQPKLSPHQLRGGLEVMLRSRQLDSRMIAMQRQGRLSFYLSSRGEEAVSVGAATAYLQNDLLFPSYRQPGLLLARGMPMVTMICQAIGNAADNAGGRQMPVHYSWRAGNVVSISSPVGTQFPQAVGASMAFAYRGERRVVGTWIGDGTAAQGDFHHALNFASVFKPPCVLHVVDNQWAISTHRNIATGGATFAARADAYRLPGLRVDGNDFLAVHAAEAWAIERARRGGGPTLIELVTYRCDAHSTSDDPTQYRAANEADQWPGGDPIERLKEHLIAIGEWSEHSHRELSDGLDREIAETFQIAESFGTVADGLGHAKDSLFEQVYAELPAHLKAQRAELMSDTNASRKEEPSILSFAEASHRAAG